MLGRTHELGLLANALDRARRERVPQMVITLGHAGAGKSRLVRELYQRDQCPGESPVSWYVGHCRPFGENVTYGALAEIIRMHAGIVDSDSGDTVRARLDAAVRPLTEACDVPELVEALGSLVGLPSALPPERSEPAWRKFFVALVSQGPTVLVFEDLHWADEPMLRFVELLRASVRHGPLFVLCTARPELVDRSPTWAGGIRGSLTVTLAPLRDTQVSELYTYLLDGLTIPDHLRDSLVRSAAGNPLYAYEYARMLSRQVRLQRDAAVDAPGMPPAVQAIIANRLDLLEPSDRTVLSAAAVVGTEFWPDAVAAATGLPVRAIDRALRRLEQRDLVHEQESSTVAWQPQYRFGHELVREVCYQRLPRAERVTRHSRIADWLEAQCGGSPSYVEVIAGHRCAAEQLAGALGQDASGYRAVPAAGAPAAVSIARPGSRRRALVPCATAARRSGAAG